MPLETIPLIGTLNQRGFNSGASFINGVDRKYRGCLFSLIPNSVTKSADLYVEKRPGLVSLSAPAAGEENVGVIYADGNGDTLSPLSVFDAVGGVTFYFANTNLGSHIGGSGDYLPFITQATFTERTWMFAPAAHSSGGAMYYLGFGANTSSFTADVSAGSPTLTNVSSPSTLRVGQLITGPGISIAGALITAVNVGASTVTMNAVASSNNPGATITNQRIAQIMNTNFTSRGRFVELNGRAYIGTSSDTIRGSGLNDINSWSSSNSISPNIKNDTLVCLERYRNLIACISRDSIEYFYDAGNPNGSPLSRAEQYFSNKGATASRVTGGVGSWNVSKVLGDDLFWIGNDFSVYKLDNFVPVPISDRSVAAIIASLVSASGPKLDGFYYSGRPYLNIVCNNGSGSTCQLLYDIQMDTWVDPNFPFLTNISGTGESLIIGDTSGTTGKLYNIDYTPSVVYQDDGSAYSMVIQTDPKFFNGGRGFSIPYVDLIADNQSSGSTTLEISRDDYGTWETIGTFDLTKTKKRIVRGGYCKSSAAFRLTDSGNNPWRGQALNVQVEPAVT